MARCRYRSSRSVCQAGLPFDLPAGLAEALQAVNLSLQGAVLILMLVVIGLLAWKGFENIFDRFSAWTYAAMAAIALTILIAAPVEEDGQHYRWHQWTLYRRGAAAGRDLGGRSAWFYKG